MLRLIYTLFLVNFLVFEGVLSGAELMKMHVGGAQVKLGMLARAYLTVEDAIVADGVLCGKVNVRVPMYGKSVSGEIQLGFSNPAEGESKGFTGVFTDSATKREYPFQFTIVHDKDNKGTVVIYITGSGKSLLFKSRYSLAML